MNVLHIFSICVAISTAIDGALLIFLLYRRRRVTGPDGVALRPPVGVRELMTSLVIVGIVFMIKLAIFAANGLGLFAWMRFVYVVAVVMIPIVCAMVLVTTIRQRSDGRQFTRGVVALASIGMLGAPLGVYATYVEPYRLQLETATVIVNPASTSTAPIRVGVLADIQTDLVTDYERGAVDRLMAERPDIVLLPGDLLQCTRREFAAQIDDMRELMKRLDAPGGAFFVEGDVDQLSRLRPLFGATPVQMLVNEIAETRVGDQRVLIGGIELNFRSADAQKTINRLINMPRRGAVKLLMSHRPDVVLHLPTNADIDLVVAGHTHGGQVVIPGFGPPMTLSQVPRHIGAGGLHSWNSNAIYVSRGVGLERGMSPRLRLFCPPEISLLTIIHGGEPSPELDQTSGFRE